MLKKLIDVKDVKCKRANSLSIMGLLTSELIITQLLPLVTIHKCADLDGHEWPFTLENLRILHVESKWAMNKSIQSICSVFRKRIIISALSPE